MTLASPTHSEYDECKAEIQTIARGIRRFGSMWELLVVTYLLGTTLRFSEILSVGEKDGLNSRTLSRTLHSLERKQLIQRKVLAGRPISVEYSLTRHGYKLEKLLSDYFDLDEYFSSLDSSGAFEQIAQKTIAKH